MAGLGLADLPAPQPEFDPELAPAGSDGRMLFEHTADAEAEDRTRAKLLRRQARKQSRLVPNADVQRLHRRLSRQRRPCTIASARYLHELRRRVVGAVWKLVRDEG